MKINPETTSREIRLHLASLVDQLEQVQTCESWADVISEFPVLGEQFNLAHTAIDDLWFKFRCATTNPGD